MRRNVKGLLTTGAVLVVLAGGAASYGQPEASDPESQQGAMPDGGMMNMMTRMNEMMEKMDRMMEMCNEMMGQMQQDDRETPAEGDAG